MPRITGQFTITHNGSEVTFVRVGESYKSVNSPSGIKSRKVVEWKVIEHDAEAGEITRPIYVLPRTPRADVVDQFLSGPNQGIIY